MRSRISPSPSGRATWTCRRERISGSSSTASTNRCRAPAGRWPDSTCRDARACQRSTTSMSAAPTSRPSSSSIAIRGRAGLAIVTRPSEDCRFRSRGHHDEIGSGSFSKPRFGAEPGAPHRAPTSTQRPCITQRCWRTAMRQVTLWLKHGTLRDDRAGSGGTRAATFVLPMARGYR